MLSHSPNILVICYLSGLRGQAVDHVLNFSPELIGKSRRLSAAADGSLHNHPGPFGLLPNGQPLRLLWDTQGQDIERLMGSARTADGMPLPDALSAGLVSTTCLLPPRSVRHLLPNATIVRLSWGKHWYMGIRDAAAKLWSTNTDSDNSIGKYLRWQAARLGLAHGDWIDIHRLMCPDPNITKRQYMRLEASELISYQVDGDQGEDYLCDLGRLFGSDATEAYRDLCRACGITPVEGDALPWLRDYSLKQWSRSGDAADLVARDQA